jgi:hypothetical protein
MRALLAMRMHLARRQEIHGGAVKETLKYSAFPAAQAEKSRMDLFSAS